MLHVVRGLEKLTTVQLSTIMIGFSLFLVGVGYWVLQQDGNLSSKGATNTITIATTIFPVADIAQNVGGDRVEVIQLLPSGASPHAFDLSPRQAAELKRAQVLFVIGHGLDDWARDFAVVNEIPIVPVDRDINLIVTDHHDGDEELEEEEDDDHEHGPVEPHYWLSVPNAMLISRTIKDVLSEQSPQYAAEFEANHNAYASTLAKTDLELRQLLDSTPHKEIAVFHAAWDYFARNYGLIILAEFEEYPGQEPTPEYVANFQAKIQLAGVKRLYYEPQFSVDQIRPIANDLGVELIMLDPLGGVAGRNSYIEMMTFNSNQIAR